jgi:hypothetical protein
MYPTGGDAYRNPVVAEKWNSTLFQILFETLRTIGRATSPGQYPMAKTAMLR